MTRVFYADASVFSNIALFEAAFKNLCSENQEKAKRLKFKEDKNLFVASRLVFEEALKGFPFYNGSEKIEKAKNGKPYFKNNSYVHFSLSHSGSIALCTVSDKNIGADVQLMCDFKEGICRRYFLKEEADYVLKAKTDCEKKERFFRIWTLKEAYSKMTGGGLGSFRDFGIQINNTISIATKFGISPASFAEFDIEGYKTAVCICGEEDNFEFKRINLFKLLIN